MLDKLKTYALEFFALVAAILAVLFVYQRNKNIVDESLLRQQQLNQDLANMDKDISNNNEQLKNEEAKRTALEKDKPSENESLEDIINHINHRDK